MKFSIKCDQIRSFRRIWSYLLKKSLTENFIFCAVSYKLNCYYHSETVDNGIEDLCPYQRFDGLTHC